MKKKIVSLISYNNLSTEFWEQHINFQNSNLKHWSNHEHGIRNLCTVWPDVVIIDGYFSKESFELGLKKVLSLKSKAIIFCLTPFPKAYNKTVFVDERLFVSKLDKEIIDKINSVLNSGKVNNSLKLTA